MPTNKKELVLSSRAVLAFLFAIVWPHSANAQSGATSVIHFRDNGKALVNPGMGWSYGYFVSNGDNWFHYWNPDTLCDSTTSTGKDTSVVCPSTRTSGYDSARSVREGGPPMLWFPGCANAFIRLGWSFFYDSVGRIDTTGNSRPLMLSRIMEVKNKFVPFGGKVALSIVVYDPYFPEKPSHYSNSPPWLRHKMAGIPGSRSAWYRIFKRPDNGDSLAVHPSTPPPDSMEHWSWAPNYEDSTFLSEFEIFLKALADSIDGKPWLDNIEIGSLGTWGEGHAWPGGSPIITRSAKLTHMKLWKKCFPKTLLIIPDEFADNQPADDCGDPSLGPPTELCQPGNHTFNIRNDSVLVDSAKAMGMGMADHSFELQNSNLSPDVAAKFNDELPVSIENNNHKVIGPAYAAGVETHKASYIRINAPADTFLIAAKPIVDSVNLRLGYRFQIVEATVPKTIIAGQNLTIKVKLRNAGVARCYKGGYAAVHLFGSGNQPIKTTVATHFNIKNLDPGPKSTLGPVTEITFTLNAPTNFPPNPSLYLSLGDADGVPLYKLPYPGFRKPGYYKLANLNQSAVNHLLLK